MRYPVPSIGVIRDTDEYRSIYVDENGLVEGMAEVLALLKDVSVRLAALEAAVGADQKPEIG